MKTKSADLVQSTKGFFLRYSSEGMSRTFSSKDEAIEFAKTNQIRIKNLSIQAQKITDIKTGMKGGG